MYRARTVLGGGAPGVRFVGASVFFSAIDMPDHGTLDVALCDASPFPLKQLYTLHR